MPLTEEEKVKIRHHGGYLDVSEVATFVLGAPAGVQTEFIIERAMNSVREVALPKLRSLIEILDTIEAQKITDLELLAVNAIGDISISQKEQEKLTEQYDYWLGAMMNLLGCYRNPFDRRLGEGGGSGFGNVAVGG